MFCLHVYLCTLCVYGALRGQKRDSDPQAGVIKQGVTATSHYVGAGN